MGHTSLHRLLSVILMAGVVASSVRATNKIELIIDPAHSSVAFHLTQIEQVMGGVNGDTSAQAIQLRMRFSGQNFLASSRVRVWDASGQNPIVVIDFPSGVPNGSQGARVLIASANFGNYTSPPGRAKLLPV